MSAHPELEELAAYAADDLDAAGAALVREHVSGCSECLADLAALTETAAELAAVPELVMPDDVAARVDAALASARSDRLPASGTVLPMRPSRRSAVRARMAGLAAGSVAAALIGVVAVGALSDRSSNKSDGRAEGGRAVSALDSKTPTFTLRRSGQAYSFDTIDAQTRQLLAGAQDNAGTDTGGEAAPNAPAGAGGSKSGEMFTAQPAPDVNARAARVDQVQRCVNLLVEQNQSEPARLVDVGSYEGTAAIVVVLPVDANRVDVWFLDAQRCGTPEAGDDVGLLYQRRVTL